MEHEGLDDLDEEDSFLKKVSVIVIGLFMVFLVLSYFLTTPAVRNVIIGMVESSDLEDDYSVDIGDGNKLIFIDNSYLDLLILYDSNLDVEIKACLFGEIIGRDYFISEIVQPTIYSQSYDRVVSAPCANDSLVSLHSHPHMHCAPSQQDLESFSELKETNPDILMIIMCEEDRFNVYTNVRS